MSKRKPVDLRSGVLASEAVGPTATGTGGIFGTADDLRRFLCELQAGRDPMAGVRFVFRVRYGYQDRVDITGEEDPFFYDAIEVEFGLSRGEAGHLTATQLSGLFVTLHRLETASEAERCRILSEIEGARDRLERTLSDVEGDRVPRERMPSDSIRLGRRAMLKALRSFPSPETEPKRKLALPPERESDRQIIETLRAVGHRLTTGKLLAEMSRRGLNPSESTVKKRLAAMVTDRRLTKDPKAKPRGYGLSEWNGSSGSLGS